jgi:hypothetical protein
MVHFVNNYHVFPWDGDVAASQEKGDSLHHIEIPIPHGIGLGSITHKRND